ncbi:MULTISPECIES: universal stress protein [unclassified Mycolicibacterium]|uniref:universal stress protein n=1 Tax=unclassified Mycolicibacterium TaxID=2636767 RepID=UPI001307F4B7|nr:MULTISPECIES: universal stress protein [unclassified Mycolicibacterium]MUL85333.1 universal stress protein [Mycolicibacterium sp. CBMA 329]MUL91300.1 universal stress protein [Mycolicibacterium sp. CBMA 331]MUM02500.1 universal stress protein [Mycolicibacterium sp. CBMA 334]MUM30177.1 universal stress protein [Mycolicibacterium sp. CBMA 295]MUM41059.1 universal stress protein [Mycolicibacterium sp. CBMA 247]
MTILAAFSASRHSSAPLNLAVQLARTTGEEVIAAAVVERSWPPRDDPVEGEYLNYVRAQATQALQRAVAVLPVDLDVTPVVHESTSVPTGLIELADAHRVSVVSVGSSSAGMLGRVALGSVTERLVHTARVPVAFAPRGYTQTEGRIRRLTAAYGGEADVNGLIPATAKLAAAWSARLRIVSFTVRNTAAFLGTIESSAEELVIQQWSRRTYDEISKQLNAIRDRMAVPEVDVVVGAGHDWNAAVQSVEWDAGDMLVLGSGAAAPTAQVFLGSAAAKILRHSPVPVMIAPRYPG